MWAECGDPLASRTRSGPLRKITYEGAAKCNGQTASRTEARETRARMKRKKRRLLVGTLRKGDSFEGCSRRARMSHRRRAEIECAAPKIEGTNALGRAAYRPTVTYNSQTARLYVERERPSRRGGDRHRLRRRDYPAREKRVRALEQGRTFLSPSLPLESVVLFFFFFSFYSSLAAAALFFSAATASAGAGAGATTSYSYILKCRRYYSL